MITVTITAFVIILLITLVVGVAIGAIALTAWSIINMNNVETRWVSRERE